MSYKFIFLILYYNINKFYIYYCCVFYTLSTKILKIINYVSWNIIYSNFVILKIKQDYIKTYYKYYIVKKYFYVFIFIISNTVIIFQNFLFIFIHNYKTNNFAIYTYFLSISHVLYTITIFITLFFHLYILLSYFIFIIILYYNL